MSVATITFTERLGGELATDLLVHEMSEGLTTAIVGMGCPHDDQRMCVDCIAGTAAEVLRELLNAERV